LALSALRNHDATPVRAAVWQTAQLPFSSCLARWANVKVECCCDKGPGLMKFQRAGPHKATSKSPVVTITVQMVKLIRLARKLSTGAHRVNRRQQVPSGSGPPGHGPPCSVGRVQR